MNNRLECYRRRWRADRAAADGLRRVPPLKASPYEYVLYALVFPLLLMAGAMPTTALFVMPCALPLLYLLYRRFGAYLPLACVGGYGVFALVFNYDVLTVVCFVFLFFALLGLIASAQLSPYLLCAATAGIFAVAGAMLGMGVVRLAERKPLGEVAARYVIAEYDDPVIGRLARLYYARADIPEDVGRVDESDAGYDAACAEYFAEYAEREFGEYSLYYCVHFGATFAAVGYFVSVLVNRRTASRFDANATREEVAASTLALGGVRVERARLADMRVPRSYLWAVVLPALVAGIALDIVGGYAMLSATVMHLFVTVPSAYAFVTLATFFASLFVGKKARIAAHVALAVVLAAMLVFPLALFVGSLIGVCDVILNLRFWTEFIRGG